MGQQHQPIRAFEREATVGFIADFTRGLANVYRKSHLETQNFRESHRGYMRPHILRAYTEEAFLTTAEHHDLVVSVPRNSKGDAHALVIDGRYVITVSRTKSPNIPPRPAKFRATYAAYCDLGQLRLPGPDFLAEQQKLVRISDRSHPMYVLITHGPKGNDWRKVGFIRANVVVPNGNGFRFFGSGVSLLERFGSEFEIATEQVPEPLVLWQDDEATDISSGQV